MARCILAILIKSSQVLVKGSRRMTIVRALHIYFGFKSWSDLHNAYCWNTKSFDPSDIINVLSLHSYDI